MQGFPPLFPGSIVILVPTGDIVAFFATSMAPQACLRCQSKDKNQSLELQLLDMAEDMEALKQTRPFRARLSVRKT